MLLFLDSKSFFSLSSWALCPDIEGWKCYRVFESRTATSFWPRSTVFLCNISSHFFSYKTMCWGPSVSGAHQRNFQKKRREDPARYYCLFHLNRKSGSTYFEILWLRKTGKCLRCTEQLPNCRAASSCILLQISLSEQTDLNYSMNVSIFKPIGSEISVLINYILSKCR